ncbi:DUF6686 family protein [Roseivirga pacifica]|uniref:DUF6686 family protein n=1 Tax=Roseivirga pacifica TaxID=1267423 RepID=UPI003BAA2A5C
MCACQPVSLVESDYINISMCLGCKRVGLHYKNILCGFEYYDYEQFNESVQRISFEKHATEFCGQPRHVILSTCHTDIQFCFTKTEFKFFKEALNEGPLMLEVQKAITNGL